MEKRRLEVDGPGYSYPRAEEQRADDNLRGALLFRALLHARARHAELVLHDPDPTVAHGNLARVLETGQLDGTPFTLVEDLRDKPTIAELVATKGAAHWQEAVALGRGLARALDALHLAGLVHGDLGLSSVHVTPRWEPLLARRIAKGDERGLGVAKNLRELGAVIYALATGTRPAEPVAVAPRAIVAEVPEALERVVLDLLAGRVVSAARAEAHLGSLAQPR